ncbi:RNA polymerase sigma factor [Rossellomorea vietnamensis]|uniref:RNA polymerase sigma factor n=1 Tax=Rossellomorea vietnamensis TaxID=218284 RepID=A0A5D4MIF5_9BACI|nr:RNA polymerase sigma factor [Rossellomorea vietnamensis]TYS01114.1 RNA polymerase sigma factor [Rossellomorea vietnamensis]
MESNSLKSLGGELRDLERTYKEEIEPYRSELWHYCYRLTRSPWDAEDLVQETLLKSFSMLTKLYQPVYTRAYLFKVASNLWIDWNRKNKFRNEPYNGVFISDKASSFDLELIDNLDYLIKHLTPNQYVSFLLTEIFDFKAKEAAGMIASTEGAVYTNVTRARAILKKEMNNPAVKRRSKPIQLTANDSIETLLEGFRQKDPDMIASVLNEEIVTDITHAGIEIGLSETKKNSLKDWKQVVDSQYTLEAHYVELWGRPVVAEMERKRDGQLYLSNIHYFEAEENHITYWKFYCFSWDLMKSAADELDVKLNAEYFYHIF